MLDRRKLLLASRTGGGALPTLNYSASYLQTVSGTPHSFGFKNTVSSARIKIATLRDNANTADFDVYTLGPPYTRPDLPDKLSMAAFMSRNGGGPVGWNGLIWTGNPTARIKYFYDHNNTGISTDLLSFANMSCVDLNQCFNDVPYFIGDSVVSDIALPAARQQYVAYTHATNATDGGTFFATMHLMTSYTRAVLFSLNDQVAMWLDQPATGNPYISLVSNAAQPPAPRVQPAVFGASTKAFPNPGDCLFYSKEVEYSPNFGSNNTATGTTFYIGHSPGLGTTYDAPWRALGFTYYPPTSPSTRMSQADVRKAHDDQVSMYGTDHDVRAWVGGDTSTFTDVVIWGGDSKNAGVYTEMARTVPSLILDRRTKLHYEFYNMAVSGQTMLIEQGNTPVDCYATRFSPLYRAALSAGHNRMLNECGHNDLHVNATTAAQLATLRTNIVTRAQSTGFKVGSYSLLPTTAFTGGEQTIRTTFNGSGASNSFQATSSFDFLVDEGNNTGLANASDTTLYPDGVHTSGKANLVRAVILEAVI